jgi:hypothetical protein
MMRIRTLFRRKKTKLDESIIELARMKATFEQSQTLLTAQIVALNAQRRMVQQNFEDYIDQQEKVIELIREYKMLEIRNDFMQASKPH